MNDLRVRNAGAPEVFVIQAVVFINKFKVLIGPRGRFDLEPGKAYALDFEDAAIVVKEGCGDPVKVDVNGDDAKTPGLALKKLQELNALSMATSSPVPAEDELTPVLAPAPLPAEEE